MDGNVFASGSSDLTFRVWDIRMKNAAFRVFHKNKCGVSSIRFMPENINTMAVGYEDASVKIWDLRALWAVGRLNDTGYESVTSMEFSKSGRFLFSSHNAMKVKCWDVLTETKVCEFGGEAGQHTDIVKSVSLSADGSTLLSSGKDGRIHKWQMQ
jgi:guanine nucleotide-binding protein G(I)/G(S)/G(T) subunit beta-1